jgi:pyridine nucleotide-disulfide oxidoreductase family protein
MDDVGRPVQPAHDIVLVGGGHTHVQVMREFHLRPEPGARLTLVTDRLLTPYSGMLPGHIAGFYRFGEMHIDLGQLAAATGTRLVEGAASGIDRASKRLFLEDGSSVPYDTLSLNIGIKPDLSGIAGATTHCLAVKPISRFLVQLERFLTEASQPGGPRRIAVIGGGAAGVELAFALRARLASAPAPACQITILARSRLVSTLNAGVQARVVKALARHGVTVIDDFHAVEVTADGVRAADGRLAAADAVLVSTAARAPDWLSGTDLPLDADGAVLTGLTLAALDDESVFAAGDCATVRDDPRPRAGVFAVRQAPPLSRNLRNRVRGRPLEAYRAQNAFLAILMTGDGSAIAGRGDYFALEGRAVWRWKDWIDRRFIRLFAPPLR